MTREQRQNYKALMWMELVLAIGFIAAFCAVVF